MKDMAEACGGADSLIVYGMPSPPLMHDEFALSKIEACAELRIPLVYAPAPTAGTTAPASVTAVVVTGNAEVLSGLVLHQLFSPGAPFVYGAGCDTLDMRTMINPYVSPEWSMGMPGGRRPCSFLRACRASPTAPIRIPSLLDEQWAAEAAMTAVMGALSRGTLAPRPGLSRVRHADVLRVHRARRRTGGIRQGSSARVRRRRRGAGSGRDHVRRPRWQPSRPALHPQPLPRFLDADAAGQGAARQMADRRRHHH